MIRKRKEPKNTDAAEVIRAFSGLSNAARALKTPVQTVHSWLDSGIPRWRWPQIREAAKRVGVNLPPSSPGRAA